MYLCLVARVHECSFLLYSLCVCVSARLPLAMAGTEQGVASSQVHGAQSLRAHTLRVLRGMLRFEGCWPQGRAHVAGQVGKAFTWVQGSGFSLKVWNLEIERLLLSRRSGSQPMMQARGGLARPAKDGTIPTGVCLCSQTSLILASFIPAT